MTKNPTRLAAPLLLTLALSACAETSHEPFANPSAAILPTEQYSIEVRQQPLQVQLALHRGGLTGPQQLALADVATRWRAQGTGEMIVQAPTSADPAAAGETAEAARAALIVNGVPPEHVQVVRYANAPGQPPTVMVGFVSYQAVGPQCGRWEDLSKNFGNVTGANYGCAVTANFAAQLANPGDLLNPRPMTPADATRRAVILDHYRKGEVSSSQRDEQANGTLSTAAGSNNQ